jgi:hypothetical protein
MEAGRCLLCEAAKGVGGQRSDQARSEPSGVRDQVRESLASVCSEVGRRSNASLADGHPVEARGPVRLRGR